MNSVGQQFLLADGTRAEIASIAQTVNADEVENCRNNHHCRNNQRRNSQHFDLISIPLLSTQLEYNIPDYVD